ncbi:MAG: anion permease, partial [Planctomycetes bacterium]|nr:anion permease [Planctomycetota bacterium]
MTSAPLPPLPAVSAVESRLDLIRRAIALPLGPLAFAGLLYSPRGLTVESSRLLAVCAWVLVWWIGEAIPLWATALLAPVLCIALHIAPPKEAFAPFADPILFLFIGSFLLVQAMTVSRLDRRFALSVLAIPGIGATPWRLMLGLGLPTLAVSMWVSDSATTAMMLPIALGVLTSAGASLARSGSAVLPQGFIAGSLLLVAYSSLIGGIGTPVGTPPNLIGMRILKEAGIVIPFFTWMQLAIPIMLTLFACLLVLFRWLHPAGVPRLGELPRFIAGERAELGGWTRGQVYAAGAFVVAVALW